MSTFNIKDITGTARLNVRIDVETSTVDDSGKVFAQLTLTSEKTMLIVAAKKQMLSTADLPQARIEQFINSLISIIEEPETYAGGISINSSYSAGIDWHNLSMPNYPHTHTIACARSSSPASTTHRTQHSTDVYKLVIALFDELKASGL